MTAVHLPLAAHLVAADTTAKSANGGLGLVVVAAIGVVLYVLLRSMSRHLRKVDKMKRDGVFDTAPGGSAGMTASVGVTPVADRTPSVDKTGSVDRAASVDKADEA